MFFFFFCFNSEYKGKNNFVSSNHKSGRKSEGTLRADQKRGTLWDHSEGTCSACLSPSVLTSQAWASVSPLEGWEW